MQLAIKAMLISLIRFRLPSRRISGATIISLFNGHLISTYILRLTDQVQQTRAIPPAQILSISLRMKGTPIRMEV